MSKILIINNGLANGGIERASSSMANHFASLGHKVVILALYKSEHFFDLHPSIVFIEPKNASASKLYMLKMMAYVRKNVKKIQPDTILAYGEWTNCFVGLALVGIKITIFYTDRMRPNGHLPLAHRILRRVFYPRAKGIIAQSEFAKRIISERTGATRIEVIYNPVNAIEKVDCEKKKTIVCVGRFTKEKGHCILVDAMARIKHSDWTLSLVGDGPLRGELEKQVKNLGLQNRVVFHGAMKEFRHELSEASLFVMPSLREGFPNALIEAMSVPLPCIATRCTEAMDEVVNDGVDAILVPAGDADVLAKAIDKLIDNPELCQSLATNAYQVRVRLDFNKIAEEHLNFILSC